MQYLYYDDGVTPYLYEWICVGLHMGRLQCRATPRAQSLSLSLIYKCFVTNYIVTEVRMHVAFTPILGLASYYDWVISSLLPKLHGVYGKEYL